MCVFHVMSMLALVVLAGESDRGGPTSSSRPALRSTTRDGGGDHIVIYKPGVGINWTRRQVELTGKVALREGMLELFACATDVYGGDKTHESIMLLDARPLHAYQALGLIGLKPGRPAQWVPETNTMLPATGQPLELRVEWLHDGRPREVDVSEWMQLADRPETRLGPLPWVFAGSGPTADGGILADEDGTVATVVDFDGSIICLSALHPSDYDQLWIAARPDKVPQLDMPCTLIVRAAGLWLAMDRFGRVTTNGRRLGPDDLAKEVRRYLKTAPKGLVHVLVAPTALPADVQALRKRLRDAGASDKAVQVYRQPASSFPADDPKAGKALLQDRLPLQESLLKSARREHKHLLDQLTTRQAAFERRTSAVADYVARLRNGLTHPTTAATTAPAGAPERMGPSLPTTRVTPTPNRR